MTDYTQLLTHACRKMPGLYLTPSGCKIRKKSVVRNPLSPQWGHHAEECQGCKGAVMRDLAPSIWQSNEEARQKRLAKIDKRLYGDGGQLRTPYCCPCGERNPKKYRPKRRAKCKACESRELSERARQKREADKEVFQVAFQFSCELHGPHNGRMMGKYRSLKCPECIRLKMSHIAKEKRRERDQEIGGGRDAGV